MKAIHRLFVLTMVSVACCCGKSAGDNSGTNTNTNNPGGNNNPVTLTSIVLNSTSVSQAAGGGSQEITITAPAQPKVDVPAAAKGWISVKEGTWEPTKFKLVITVTLTANDAYSCRRADIGISASGVSSVTLPVKQAGREEDAYPASPANDAEARARELGLGWNLGNHLDAYSNDVANETCWGNPKATQATFDGLKAAGFMTVRIPVTWMGHIGASPNYKIEEAWIARVEEVVGYAEKAGLKVILNTHHDEDHGDNHWQNLKNAVNDAAANERIKEEISAVWTQIAQRFKDKGDFLMLESFNELIYGSEWASYSNTEKKCNVINEWNQVFVDAVRATGGNNATRWLGVPGYAANPGYLKYVTVPVDPAGKTMLAFHCYDPYDYTIGDKQLADWGHSGSAYKNGEEEINALFSSLHDTYVANNIPLYMGEFGCSFRDSHNTKAWSFFLYYLEYVVKAAKTYGIPAILWDNGAVGTGKERHGYIDHGTGDYVNDAAQQAVRVMTKAWKCNDSSYTLDSVYNSAP